jgi:Cu/Ag efflux protein CusF
VLLLCVALAASAAAQPAAVPQPDWRGTGTVVAMLRPPSDLHATRPVVVLTHEPIPGLMEQSMSMPFIVASVVLFEDLHTGDRVSFALKETPDALLVISLDRFPR